MMLGCLGTGTECARTDVVLDEGTDAQPGIFLMDEFQGSVLPKVASGGMIMKGLVSVKTGIVSSRDKDTIAP